MRLTRVITAGRDGFDELVAEVCVCFCYVLMCKKCPDSCSIRLAYSPKIADVFNSWLRASPDHALACALSQWHSEYARMPGCSWRGSRVVYRRCNNGTHAVASRVTLLAPAGSNRPIG